MPSAGSRRAPRFGHGVLGENTSKHPVSQRRGGVGGEDHRAALRRNDHPEPFCIFLDAFIESKCSSAHAVEG